MSTAATYEIYYCEAAAGTEWERKSCAESHGEKKNLMAFPNSSRGKKVSQDTKSERKKKWEGEKKNRNPHTHAYTHKCWAPHPVGVKANAVESAQTLLPAPGKDGRWRADWDWRNGGLKCPENNTSCREAGGGSEPSSSSWRTRNLTKFPPYSQLILLASSSHLGQRTAWRTIF